MRFAIYFTGTSGLERLAPPLARGTRAEEAATQWHRFRTTLVRTRRAR